MTGQKEKNKGKFRGLGLISLGWEIALPIFGGVILGFYMDRWLQTKYVFTLILLGFGIFTGYYNLYKRIELEMLRKKLHDEQKNKGDDQQ
ncbi:MAG: AtpZ/AtpI family protein [Brevefilum sp.]|nr:AtpZ/AtpI family protein [Brevefilum sp.]